MSASPQATRAPGQESPMTVSELRELLEGCDPEAEVRIMSQEGL